MLYLENSHFEAHANVSVFLAESLVNSAYSFLDNIFSYECNKVIAAESRIEVCA